MIKSILVNALLMVFLSSCAKADEPGERSRAETAKPPEAVAPQAGLVQVEAGPVLAEAAERAHPGRPTGKMLALPSAVFSKGERVRVSWFDTPGNAQDWVTVVKVGTADNMWGDWVYTAGKREGTLLVSGLAVGDWEARLYFDWPKGKFQVQERLLFTVLPKTPALDKSEGSSSGPLVKGRYLALAGKQVKAGKALALSWSGTSGQAYDWLTVVPQGTPDNKWGPWMFTGSSESGVFKVPPLEPGRYQARLYFDWPKGKFEVRDRLDFEVR